MESVNRMGKMQPNPRPCGRVAARFGGWCSLRGVDCRRDERSTLIHIGLDMFGMDPTYYMVVKGERAPALQHPLCRTFYSTGLTCRLTHMEVDGTPSASRTVVFLLGQ